MGLFFYLLGFIAMVVTTISALLYNRGIIKNKKKSIKVVITSLVATVAFFGLGLLLDSDGSNNPSSNKNHTVAKKEKTFPPVTKSQYNKLKIGMTIKEVSNIFGKKPSDYYIVGTDGNETWTLDGENKSSVDFNFENNKLVEKSETGLLSANSDTITDKNGEKNYVYQPTKTSNDDYASSAQTDIENTIGSTVDWSLNKQVDTVKSVEVNDNLGKKDGSKLILLHLNAPVTGTNNAIKKLVNEDTLKIAKAIMSDNDSLDFKKDRIVYFWYLPLTDSYGKTKSSEAYKISLESSTLKKIDYNHLNDVDLPAIADQYNILFKE